MACKALHDGTTHICLLPLAFVMVLQNTPGQAFPVSVSSTWHALPPEIYLACCFTSFGVFKYCLLQEAFRDHPVLLQHQAFLSTHHFPTLCRFAYLWMVCTPPHTTCKPHKEAKTLSCSPLRSQYLSQSSHSMNGERGG